MHNEKAVRARGLQRSITRRWSDMPWTFLRWYTFAALAVGAATGITALVLYGFGPRPNPLIFFSYLLAILASAWWGGHGPGLFAVALSHFGAPYLLLPAFDPAKVDVNRVALTTPVTLLVSRVASTRARAESVLRKMNDELEKRVQERTAALVRANTRLEALTAGLQRSNDELRRSNDDLERFAYIASHDLQEPLRIVGTYASLLARRYRGRLDADAGEMIDYLVAGTARMRELITAVLGVLDGYREQRTTRPG